ncbi:hypothetical protein I4I73_30640 [Pseudonocardia sp. KRD-184]|uniref:Lipoprotein n=1 Tax=Pseudonocardia oceani TaxID=2792013 RepID=A0ABS6UBF8_9PSEU|nr:hypothetical protein [Pseudonocardia oceani]MBW0093658.1 hypothetical protein [Pseudonocardia oceani]MBW0100342.1 hypothetical protein [Pseudonocardia oceani]MBW0113034.1 hypothetical protein [Pseudonocardia oceani]MBW0125781.1 hypothetical protein [Pseudonocardia oceani]MBW0129579.1 hypothetical protein [Pseudonocardia oceani]
MAAACAAVLTGCGDDAGTAGPEQGVTVGEVQEAQNFYEGEYLGQRVTVSAEVTDVLDPRHLELAGRDYGEDSLLVRTTGPVDAIQGQVVRVVGTVGQYHLFRENEGPPPVQYDMYEEYETEAYLYDATVEVLGS